MTEQNEQTISGLGNKQTKPEIPECKFQSKNWVMTFNNYPEQIFKILEENLIPLCDKYVFGKEVGEQGTPHIQGAFVLKSKMRQDTIWKLIGSKCYLDKMKGKWNAQKYCVKQGNEILTNHKFPKPVKVIEEHQFYQWQKDILEICKTEPDDRTIYWYWESKGNVGKTAFIKHMVLRHKSLFCNGGKYTDIMNLVFNQNMEDCNVVFFDIPRGHGGKISYSSLESIKNGMVCNTKYETGTKIFNPPHIFIFANFEPDEPEKLSSDRWVIKNLD